MHELNRNVLASQSGVVVTSLRSDQELEAWRPFWDENARHLEADRDFFSLVVRSRPEVQGPYLLGAVGSAGPCGLLVGRLEQTELPVRLGYVTLAKLSVRQVVFPSESLLGERSPERAQLFADAILTALRRGEADAAVLENLPSDSPLLQACRAMPRRYRGLTHRLTEHWRGTLPVSGDEFFKKLSRGHRKKLRHAGKVLESTFSAPAECRRYEGSGDVAAFCQTAEMIARTTYQRGLGVGFSDNAQNRALVQLGADRGWWSGWVLSVAGRPIAFWTGLTYRDCCYGYWTGYDPAYGEYEVGSLVFLRVIDSLCAAGVKRIDYGIGSALYKERFGDERKIETSFRVFGPNVRGLTRNLCFSGGVAMERAMHGMLQRIRLTGRLKRFLRSRATSKASAEAAAGE